MTSLRALADVAVDDDLWRDVAPGELYQEPLTPFSWRTTVWSAVAWPLPSVSILSSYLLLRALDRTVLPGPNMFRLPKFCAKLTMLLGGVRVRTYGRERLDLSNNYVFVPNHVSMFDAPVLSVASPVNARAFQERSHLEIPIYGGFTKLFGEVLVDRADKELNEAAHREALRQIREGMSWLVFPEGQRSRDGRLGPFYPGAFRLAIAAGVPVVPVAQRGIRNICPPGEWRVRPGVVQVVYGDPIATTGMTEADVGRLQSRTRRELNVLLARNPQR